MNSVLNPEAPEFFPHLTSVTQVREPAERQSGFTKVNKTIKSSNSMPLGIPYNVFKTFADFNVVTCHLTENIMSQSNQILVKDASVAKLIRQDDEFDAELLTDINDTVLDRVEVNIDTVAGVRAPDDKFATPTSTNQDHGNVAPWNREPIITKIQVGSTTLIGAKNIPRPQLSFKDIVDNSDTLWVPKISDKPNNIKPLSLNILYNDNGEAIGYEHPYSTELDVYHPPSRLIDPDSEPPSFPPPVHETPLTYVATETDLNALVDHLCIVTELAVDVEHHHYRTYQGITCLLQISTKEGGDFIIDTLVIREHIHKLNLIFTNPKKLKVFHGAESDVLWLQRDFGLYIVGLFDTHQAAKILKMPGLSLKYLLKRYCNVDADKTHQLADWRIRPLPDVLIEYARMDTHYLLYVWRVMKAELLEAAGGQSHLLLSVFEESRQICGLTYNKEVLHEKSHLSIFGSANRILNARQMTVLKMLYNWRDAQGRLLDESPSYLIPNHMVVALALHMPREVQGVNACCDPTPPFVKQNVLTIHKMILTCRNLPMQPTLYRPLPLPPSERKNEDPTEEGVPENCHDLSGHPEPGDEENAKVDPPEGEKEAPKVAKPDIRIFKQGRKRFKKYKGVVSTFNADAKLFVPPYDRFSVYRTIAQKEEVKNKEKEAKTISLSDGNELVKKEVLLKVQTEQPKEEEKKEADPEPEKETGAEVEKDGETSDADTKRLKKISEKKAEKKEIPVIVLETKKVGDAKPGKAQGSNLGPNRYKNANYKKFYDDTKNTKNKKQPKARPKKHKK